MAITADQYWPFDSGPGGGLATEDQYRRLFHNAFRSGVIRGEDNGLLPYADSTGMHVKVPTGKTIIRGHYAEFTSEKVLPVAANATGDVRADTVVARADFVANRVEVDVVTGSSPSTWPAPVQNASRWEIVLALVFVPDAAVTIAAVNVVDWRQLFYTPDDVPPFVNGFLSDPTFSVPGNTFTVVPFDGIEFDTHAGWDATNHRYTIPDDWHGIWEYGAVGEFDIDTNGNRGLGFWKNGAFDIETPGWSQVRAATDVGTVLNPSGLAALYGGMHIDVRAYQNSGGALDLVNANFPVRFWARWVRPLR